MNADGSALLAQLQDIHSAGQPLWWPPAPGWWVLAVVVLLIIALLVLDFIIRKRVRAIFRYCIWMLVLAKLVLPTSFPLRRLPGLRTGPTRSSSIASSVLTNRAANAGT